MLKHKMLKRTLEIIFLMFAFFILFSCTSIPNEEILTSYLSDVADIYLSIPIKENYQYIENGIKKNFTDDVVLQKNILKILKRCNSIVVSISLYEENKSKINIDGVIIGNFPKYFVTKSLQKNELFNQKKVRNQDYYEYNKIALMPISNNVLILSTSIEDMYLSSLSTSNVEYSFFDDDMVKNQKDNIFYLVNDVKALQNIITDNKIQIGIDKVALIISKNTENIHKTDLKIRVADKRVIKIAKLLFQGISQGRKVETEDELTLVIRDIDDGLDILINMLKNLMEE